MTLGNILRANILGLENVSPCCNYRQGIGLSSYYIIKMAKLINIILILNFLIIMLEYNSAGKHLSLK